MRMADVLGIWRPRHIETADSVREGDLFVNRDHTREGLLLAFVYAYVQALFGADDGAPVIRIGWERSGHHSIDFNPAPTYGWLEAPDEDDVDEQTAGPGMLLEELLSEPTKEWLAKRDAKATEQPEDSGITVTLAEYGNVTIDTPALGSGPRADFVIWDDPISDRPMSPESRRFIDDWWARANGRESGEAT